MQSDAILLKWFRHADGYKIRSLDEFEANAINLPPWEMPTQCIFPRSDRLEEYVVGLGEKQIFSELLACSDEDAAIIAFSNKWGTLDDKFPSRESFLKTRNWFRHIYTHRFKLRELATAMVSRPLGTVEIRFDRRTRRSSPELLCFVKSLHDFLWLEVAQDLGNTKRSFVVRCSRCGKLRPMQFITGRKRKYCSNGCKQADYRDRVSDRH